MHWIDALASAIDMRMALSVALGMIIGSYVMRVIDKIAH